MDLFELELARRLARREPARGFSGRVMEEVRREAAQQPAAAWGRRTRTKAWTWGVTGALAASLAIGAFVRNQRVEQRAAEQAEAQLFEALNLAGEKIQFARVKANGGRAEGGN